MSIYHCSIKIISRAGGRSAVASAAYRSGERLYNDEIGIIHDFTNKGGVIMNEIILPVNAPERYQDREILWNEVQKIEKRSDAQFAREIEVALPVEMNRVEQIECVRAFVNENFVSQGMIVDWALHDKEDGNPHAHILLTMRGIDEHEEWLQKQTTVFANARDGKGRPIYNPELPVYDSKNREATSQYRIPQLDENGEQKTRVRKGKGTEYLWEKITIPANDWNEHSRAEIWRASWAEHCNKYLDVNHRIDHRSYERQGIDKEPSVHEGVTARQMEAEGKIVERCQINREIKERNSFSEQMKAIAKELTDLITEKARAIYGRFKEFRRSNGDIEYSRSDDGGARKSTGRAGGKGQDDSKSQGRNGRIYKLKRAADETEQEIDKTDGEIAITDSRIAELRDLIKQKAADRDERFRKLKERRSASINDGGDAGSNRGITDESPSGGREDLRSTKDDIQAFLGELEAKERSSEEKRDYRISERENRETERERSRIEKERGTGEGEYKTPESSKEDRGRSRSKGRSR